MYVCMYVCVHMYVRICMHVRNSACYGTCSYLRVHIKGDADSMEEQKSQVAGADGGTPRDDQWNQSDCDAILHGSKGKLLP